MRILIEEYQYKAEDVKDVFKGIDVLENAEGKVSLNYVGYFYNTQLSDCVFILPKVLLEDKEGLDKNRQELVFGKYSPESIINIDKFNPLTQQEKDFIYEFTVWIYRAICVFRDDKQNDTNIVLHKQIIQIGKGKRKLSNTFLDILLTLIQWGKDNQDFVMFMLKNQHAGFNKINWTRTIAKSDAIIQNNRPVYLNPVNKKRRINFDEELLVIFYSILNYIGDHYGFAKHNNFGFSLITGKQFENYLKGFGKIRLHQIKYKYYSDKALELWELCFAFFDSAKQVQTNTQQKEYLLVKNFNIVFEAIIDELIGDKNIPVGLKKQDDGKMVDHFYTYQGLTTHENKPIYYIGDSKYYKRKNKIGGESIYKQFTYARNVIQWNLNLFLNDNSKDENLKKDKKNFNQVPMLRDEVTEGYNIIPNFFISAKLNEELNYDENISITDKNEDHFTNRHFKNRLFDRDTLLVCHYDVNFLYVVSLYARNNTLKKEQWKKKVREIFRKEIQEILAKSFEFYAMQSRPGVDGETYIKEHFQDVLGKVYSPFDNKKIYSLALDKEFGNENKELLAELNKFFYVEKIKLGDNPEPAIAKVVANESAPVQIETQVLTAYVPKSESNYNDFVEHKAASYDMRKIQSFNLMDVKFLLPMVNGDINGVYKIEKFSFKTFKDEQGNSQTCLHFKLGDYFSFGNDWIKIYKTKMEPGELISMQYSLELYKSSK